ncbi:MAG TPA: hypothetical protein GX518_04060 [Firmicutes bacterium]|nr:hypothetical protein [Bacillota bacterium]
MRKTVLFFLVVAVILGGTVLYRELDRERSEERSAPGEGRTKINREGDVEAIVTFLSEDLGTPPAELTFKVELKSTGFDLSDYDPAETATLLNARQEKLSTGFWWEEEEAGANYLRGLLRVSNKLPAGTPFWEKEMDSLTLQLRDLGKSRVKEFHWVF